MRFSGAFARFVRQGVAFAKDQRAAVTVEFVVAVPLLMAVLAFAVQYGYAMQVRNALDVAVRDAARYMSRAPIDETSNSVSASFLSKAEQLVNDRISDAAAVTVDDMLITDDVVAIKATATVELPLLQILEWFSTEEGELSRIPMVSCEGWAVSESRNAGGVLAQAISGAPFLNCPDANLAAMAGP
ncbi:MAG: TadE/TadG family type IV pilus assembly protein [Pseudomonadota bacterium]